MGKDGSSTGRTIWGRVTGIWHRTDRARAIAQIPVVALSPAAGPVADQVRLSPPQDLVTMRREADLEQQKQWGHHELHQIEGRTGYVIRENNREADRSVGQEGRDRGDRDRGDRDRTAHER